MVIIGTATGSDSAGGHGASTGPDVGTVLETVTTTVNGVQYQTQVTSPTNAFSNVNGYLGNNGQVQFTNQQLSVDAFGDAYNSSTGAIIAGPNTGGTVGPTGGISSATSGSSYVSQGLTSGNGTALPGCSFCGALGTDGLILIAGVVLVVVFVIAIAGSR